MRIRDEGWRKFEFMMKKNKIPENHNGSATMHFNNINSQKKIVSVKGGEDDQGGAKPGPQRGQGTHQTTSLEDFRGILRRVCKIFYIVTKKGHSYVQCAMFHDIL
jgi:hypothetical protein